MRRFAACFLAVLTALPGWSAEVTNFTLGNGMDVVVIEDHRAPVAVHMVWYRAGAADEPPGKSGIAHFLEHLMFKGTDDLESGEFSEVVSANGGSSNAFTSLDYTAYHQRVAADRLELMMRMEADRMRDLMPTEADVATERQVVIEERNQRIESNPGALFGEQQRAALYLNHPYGIPIIGWRHEIESLTLEDALDYYRAHYAPNNAILIVAGDVDPDDVRRLAEKHYGPLEPLPGLKPRMRPSEPPQLAERRLLYEDERISEPYFTRAYMAPGRNPGSQEDAAALLVLAEVLGGSQATSVLGRQLQLEKQMANYTAAYYRGVSYDSSAFSLIVVPVPGVSLEEAEAALDESIAGFLADGVDPGQLDRIKMQLRASQIYALDSVQGLANRYGAALASGLTLEDIEAWPDILQSVTANDIHAAAERVLDRNSSVTGWARRPQDAEAAQ